MNCILQIVIILVALFVIKIALISLFFYAEIRAAQKRDPAAKSFWK